jgi:hypothetical protein
MGGAPHDEGQRWLAMLSGIAQEYPTLAVLLRRCQWKVSPDALIVLPPSQFHRSLLRSTRRRDELALVAQRWFGRVAVVR